jgi:hypothetical protein
MSTVRLVRALAGEVSKVVSKVMAEKKRKKQEIFGNCT